MNLVMMRNNVEDMKYHSVKSLVNDVVTMTTNCKTYTPDPYNDYHVCAKKVEKLFMEKVRVMSKNDEELKKLINPKLEVDMDEDKKVKKKK